MRKCIEAGCVTYACPTDEIENRPNQVFLAASSLGWYLVEQVAEHVASLPNRVHVARHD